MRQHTRALLPAVFIIVLSLPIMLFASTETSHVEKSFPIGPGDTVVVDASFHTVEINARSGGTVDVVVDLEVSASEKKAREWLADYEPQFKVQGDSIIIRSTRKKTGWSWRSTNGKGRIAVAMPPGVDVVVDTSSGSVRLEGDFGDADVSIDNSSGAVTGEAAMAVLTIDNSSGGAHFTAIRPLQRFDVDCSSGSVELEGGAHRAKVDASSGSIRLAGLLGDASVDTSSGSVRLSWLTVTPGARVDVDTSSGGARLTFPPGTELDGAVSTSSGGIHSDFPGQLDRKGDHLSLEGGPDAVRLRVSTSSGGVKIYEKD